METLEKGKRPKKRLSQQLQCPTGEEGRELAQSMFESNKGMILDSLFSLKIKEKNRILELGPGNGAHLPLLFGRASGLKYFGLDVSKDMEDEAKKNNESFITDNRALFAHYDGESIPYVHNFFDRILTVNTIYFWERPKAFLNELHRVLKWDGICVITFVEGNFMKKLPFVDDSFELFDISRFAKLVLETPFKNVDVQTRYERVRSKAGEIVDREFLVATLQKSPIEPEQA
nr:class I SAM-dependent methyltransferase [Allomuricauda sp.]